MTLSAVRTASLATLALGLLALAPWALAQDTAQPADETLHTREAVLAVDDHWTQAWLEGDVGYVDRLLLPEYRSVTPDGVAYSRAETLAFTAKNRGDPHARERFEAHRKAHPTGRSVVLDGDLAILSFYVPALGPQKGVKSSDVFVYRNGRWRVAYSQHSDAEKR